MLDAQTPLSGFDQTINDVHIREIGGLSIVSLAVPDGGLGNLATAVKKSFTLELPAPGRLTSTAKSSVQLVWTAPDQYFLIRRDVDDPAPATSVKGKIGGKAYVTDQSDSWVTIAVSGDRVLEALERICPINLHPDEFLTGMAARTQMEHLGAIIMRTGKNEWHLMSARSSAASFLHAITQSANNI